MVERELSLDDIFGSLADETRRSILSLVAGQAMSVGQIAEHFTLTYGAISKHILVLEKSRLITKHRRGKEQLVSVSPVAIDHAEACLRSYQQVLEARLESLDRFVTSKNKEQEQ